MDKTGPRHQRHALRLALLGVVVPAVLPSLSCAPDATERTSPPAKLPNVVLIMTDDREVSVTLELPAGEMDVQAWFVTDDGEEFGANYVYVAHL